MKGSFIFLLVALIAGMLLVSAYWQQPQSEAAAAVAPAVKSGRAGCPVTRPPQTPFIPPAPYPAEAPYGGDFWYGTNALWTALPGDGAWQQLLYGEKVFWWRDGYNWRAEPQPALTMTARRLDGEAPAIETWDATNGYHPDLKSFMLTGLGVPAAGCWEITGRYGETALSFVVWVAP